MLVMTECFPLLNRIILKLRDGRDIAIVIPAKRVPPSVFFNFSSKDVNKSPSFSQLCVFLI